MAIIRNENSVELNLIFNANAGDRVHPGDDRRPEGEAFYQEAEA